MFEPKCPKCGKKATLTNWSMPYPQWQCISCNQAEKAKREKQTEKLEEKTNG